MLIRHIWKNLARLDAGALIQLRGALERAVDQLAHNRQERTR